VGRDLNVGTERDDDPIDKWPPRDIRVVPKFTKYAGAYPSAREWLWGPFVKSVFDRSRNRNDIVRACVSVGGSRSERSDGFDDPFHRAVLRSETDKPANSSSTASPI